MFSGLSFIGYFLDILIIALFIYSILLFIRRTRSYTVFLGLLILLGFYLLARVLDLKLTLLTLQNFIGISVVIFAVVFQTELRRYFELLGLIGSRQIRVGKFATRSPEMHEIIRASVELAKSKHGALIVIAGRDELTEHIEGGVDLDGIISEEIILGNFFPNSAGHDGAMVIKNNRIAKFGVHLPLSVNFKEVGKHGTRHSAGLGLTEKCDALCIVISEEHGTISVCRDGKLKTLEQPRNIEKELDKFIKAKYQNDADNGISRIVKHNFWLKVAAIFLAGAFWFINR